MNATREAWKPVKHSNGQYEVSNIGRCRSNDFEKTDSMGRKWRRAGRMLSPRPHPLGYMQVTMQIPGLCTTQKVHRLVAEAFIGDGPAGMVVCHNNGDATDNRVENLRWDTQSSNMYDCVDHGTHQQASKTHCKQGHEFSEQNTYRNPKGYRTCRTCQAASIRKYRQKNIGELRAKDLARYHAKRREQANS